MNYHYALNGNRIGPVSEEELQRLVAAGTISADTPIWREGMADWQPYSVALGGAQALVKCDVCNQSFPTDQTVRVGETNVCAGCKPRFLQGLREGETLQGTMELAGIGTRFAAKFLDNIMIYVIQMGLNFAILGTMGQSRPGSGGAAAAAGGILVFVNFSIAIIYQAVFLHWKGQTLGKMATKIRVVTPEGGSLTWGKAFGRPVAEILSGCLLAIGYLMAIWDPQKRALHDRLAGTRVIKVKA